MAEWLQGPRSRALRRAGIGLRESVLEVGAGHCVVTPELQRRARGRVVAIDIAPHPFVSSIPDDAAGVCADLVRLPFAGGSFDLVFAQNTLLWVHHLPAAVGEAVGATKSPGDALGAGVHAFFSFLDSDRAAWAVLFDETLPQAGEVAERVAEYRGNILAFVSASMLAQLPSGKRDGAKVEIEALSTALLGAAEALARWWLRTQAVSADEAAELLIATIEPGLRQRSELPTSPPRSKGQTTA